MAMPLATGQVLNNRYRIVKLLGQGGFGAVYRAWDISLERPCAIKENLGTSPEAQRQFKREATILANLSHPNLPRVTDHFIIEGQGQYLVMDFVEGEDLQTLLERNGGPLPEAQVLPWVLQVCDALAYMHAHEPPVIHRDIKPSNIKITSSGDRHAMLVDFGIAKIFDPHAKTTVGAKAVTPGFSPPEQYGQGTTDARSDIYALGATMYVLLTGKELPESVDIMSGSAAQPSLAQMVNPAVSSRVSLALAQAIRVNRSERYDSANAFKTALLQGGAVSESTNRVPLEPTSRIPRVEQLVVEAPRPRVSTAPPKQRRGWCMLAALGIGAVVVLSLVAGGIFYAFFWKPTPAAPNVVQITPLPTKEKTAEATKALPTKVPPTNQVSTITPIPTPVPSITASGPTEALIEFPSGKLAFVSDLQQNNTDRIYVIEFTGGSYTQSSLQAKLPVSAPNSVLNDGDYTLAWWPDWCENNQAIYFEGQKLDGKQVTAQTVYSVHLESGGNATPLSLPMDNGNKLGVPRCSNMGKSILYSMYNTVTSKWEMYRYDFSSAAKTQIGAQFRFAGYSSWFLDDSWVVYMALGDDGQFHLFNMAWATNQTRQVAQPADLNVAKYPSVSRNGEVAYACSKGKGSNHLCITDRSGNPRVELKNLVADNSRPLMQIPEISPSWSPDGNWIAYSSNKNGNWDIYLYSPSLKIEFNLTASLPSNEFEPSWSK